MQAALLLRNFVGMPIEKIKEREAAQQFFVEMFWDAKTIALHLMVDEKTVGKWRAKYKWDKLREDTINNPVKMRTFIAQQMMLIVQGQKSTIDADALAKMFKVYEGISDKINPGIVAAVLKLYDDFLSTKAPKLALQNLPFNKEFLIHIVNTYG